MVRKGSKMSEKAKRKISEAMKGQNHMLGKTHSEETKRKMSEVQKARRNQESLEVDEHET